MELLTTLHLGLNARDVLQFSNSQFLYKKILCIALKAPSACQLRASSASVWYGHQAPSRTALDSLRHSCSITTEQWASGGFQNVKSRCWVGLCLQVTSVGDERLRIRATSPPRAVDITTLPYPGFPTDMQPQARLGRFLVFGVVVVVGYVRLMSP